MCYHTYHNKKNFKCRIEVNNNNERHGDDDIEQNNNCNNNNNNWIFSYLIYIIIIGGLIGNSKGFIVGVEARDGNRNCMVNGQVRVEWDMSHSTTGTNLTSMDFRLYSSTIDRIFICQGFSFIVSGAAKSPSFTPKGMFINVPYYFFCNHIVYEPRNYDTFGGYSYSTCVKFKNETYWEKCEPSQLENVIFGSNTSRYTHEEEQLTFTPLQLMTNLRINSTLLPGLDNETMVQVVFKRSIGLQEFVKYSNNQSYSRSFILEEQQFEMSQTFKLIQSHGWESDCDSAYFQTRPLYNIWKGISCLIVALVCVGLLIMLIIARKNRYIQSRFFSPYFSTILFFIASSLRFGFVVALADNYYMNLVMTAILILVFSLYTLQTVRYFLSRWFYKKYYESERKETFWFRFISSKFTYVICSVLVIGIEIIVIYLASDIEDFSIKNDVLDYLTVAAFAVMIILSLGSTVLYLLANRVIIKQLGSFVQVVKWYFLYDDTFKYHAEFFTVIITAISGVLYFLLSWINNNYMSKFFLPVSNMLATHIVGYAMYGISKTIFEVCLVCFEPGYLLFIYWHEYHQPAIEFEGLKQLKSEMEMFFANTIDEIPCVDIMKRFLTAEFRAELLEIYFFINNNNSFTEKEMIDTFSYYVIQNIINVGSTSFKLKESVETNLKKLEQVIEESSTKFPPTQHQGIVANNLEWKKKFTSIVTFQLIEAFSRLKQTPTYKTHYLGMKEFENQFVSKVLAGVTVTHKTESVIQ
ncbi:predicted protein [Naegleria gruberi]|uniref:Predicted protein n=1 Tax=Naegleria gruberi TaxID=5762 RepID=D2VYD3_NAEGR|nr:uncharacterized protein NAEGRDRAFT_74079 [Naegleria gruberi]EFC38223.1 predicted protein [Naegleria gruberi]|eukprot:XP_002670967.1 predicted protein [Naegleria gruberi strain NEG-M]